MNIFMFEVWQIDQNEDLEESNRRENMVVIHRYARDKCQSGKNRYLS